jgi:hypothetical protein
MTKRVFKKDIDPDLLWNTAYLSNNRLCAISIKTTGPDSRKNELVQICCFPLNSQFNLARDVVPYYTDIKPLKSGYDHKYLKKEHYINLLNCTQTPQTAAELFDKWMENKIKLSEDKKLLPVCYNWPLIRPFIKNWLGNENFNYYFHERFRDILPIALYCNDYYDSIGRDVPYLKTILRAMAKRLHVEYHRHNECILQCKTISEIYKGLMLNMS